jgi:hypothetical protein
MVPNCRIMGGVVPDVSGQPDILKEFLSSFYFQKQHNPEVEVHQLKQIKKQDHS